MIDISGCDKVDVLIALYNNAKAQGNGLLHYKPENMTKEQARSLLSRQTYFDYVHGRVMKVDLSKDVFDPWLYDRDNGSGAAFAALKEAGLDI